MPRLATAALVTLALVACGADGQGGERARVIAVTDGDTFKVELPDGQVVSVRLLGVDAPDFGSDRDLERCNDPSDEDWDAEYCQRWRKAWDRYRGTPTLDIQRIRGCYDEGLAVLRNLLQGREVTLVPDPTVGNDPFGRPLRYVEDDRGDDVSRMLVDTGRAIVFGPCGRCDDLLAVEAARAAAHEGCLWAE